ncbi:MAG: PIN domain-containing protein [Candidatus Diapherotrites archaeon]|uniref:PIN domain-containing protein n=1 Tax=Candidatus Iainarchaeum sp. TaxID=3101447 RepID=A0A8T3YL72_9ARCH|nr:PIN domain-containing protein [Candidatus Diapherotrites archaeon]
MRNNEHARTKAEELKNEKLATTSINLFEALVGLYAAKERPEKEEAALRGLLGAIDVIEFDSASSFEAAHLMAKLMKSGRMVKVSDCLVIGVMLSMDCTTIVTRDRKHFGKVERIKVETY